MKYKKYLFSAIGILFYILFSSASYAADFNILPGAGTLGVNKEVVVNIKIDTAGATINAAQAKLSFNPATLGVKSISKDGSVFNFWLQEPKFSNTDGTIEFIAGTANGVSGASLQVLQITFVTKGVGSSNISFAEASIADDGSGTDILSKANGAKFTIEETSVPVIPGTSVVPIPIPIPTPVQIKRIPTQATGLPATPVISVALYPNPSDWYNFVSQFTPNWKLPPDISGLSTALNTNPNFVVPPVSEGLFEAKTFPAISKDGISYVHVRFQNNIGWGPTAHYRISLDTQPPLPFQIEVKTGLASDNPSPELLFRAGDALSGIDSYVVTVNAEDPVTIDSSGVKIPAGGGVQTNRLEIIQTSIGYVNVRDIPGTSGKLVTKVNPGEIFEFKKQENGWYQIVLASGDLGWVTGTYVKLLTPEGAAAIGSNLGYKMSPHEPGVYVISVRAVDGAGNILENKVKVEILPIETPVITSITQKIIIGTDTPLIINGTAILGTDIIVKIEDKDGLIVLQNETKTNSEGKWEFSFDRGFKRGDYTVTVKARDSRGALSLPTEPIKVKFAEKTIITLFGWDVTLRDIVIALIITGVLSALWFYRKTLLRLARSQRESTIINRDIKNAFDVIKEDLNTVADIAKKSSSAKTKAVEINDVNKKIKDALDKIETYSSKDIENLK